SVDRASGRCLTRLSLYEVGAVLQKLHDRELVKQEWPALELLFLRQFFFERLFLLGEFLVQFFLLLRIFVRRRAAARGQRCLDRTQRRVGFATLFADF